MNDLARRLLGIPLMLGLCLLADTATGQVEPRAAIEAANARFSADFTRGDASAVAAHYTAGAQAFPGNSDIVRGREAIERFWKGVMEAGVKGIALTVLEVEGHGDTAHEVGTYTLTGEGGKVLDTGKYIVIWKRDAGAWKLHRDIWNTSVPAAK